jgi:hypothetical protein
VLLAELRRCGAHLYIFEGVLRCRAVRGALSAELRSELAAQKEQIAALIETSGGIEAAETEIFLSDSSIPAAIFHSRALGRDFVLARDRAVLNVLTEANRVLPVLFFRECGQLARLSVEGLRAVLDLRAAFGPSARLQEVSRSDG